VLFQYTCNVTWRRLCATIVVVKLKEPLNRPGVAHRVPGGLGSQISMTFGT